MPQLILQAILFPVQKFSREDSINWLTSFGFKRTYRRKLAPEQDGFLVYKQAEPAPDGRHIVTDFIEGIKFVYGQKPPAAKKKRKPKPVKGVVPTVGEFYG